jgi:hypothetical protein
MASWKKFGLRMWVVFIPLLAVGAIGGVTQSGFDKTIDRTSRVLLAQGRQVFRYDTFGDEAYWGDTLQLHQAIKGEALGGVGPGVSPTLALGVGLKVDAEALPKDIVDALKKGTINLDDPATTVALLSLNAVVGVQGVFDEQGSLKSVGITCALCHSDVDDSLAPGIGKRLDGWANRDLNVGAIVALAPNLQPVAERLGTDVATVRTVLNSWGPGKYDAELNMDGKAFRPDGKPAATLIPPAFGLAGVNLHTWNGWGSVPYWNAYVAVTQMRGRGTFFDPRLNDPKKYRVAAATGDWNIRNSPDLVTAKLPALHYYQLSLPAPEPPKGSFDKAAAVRGAKLFEGAAGCAACHVPPLYTEPGWAMHSAEEMDIDDFQARRSPDGLYRTPPLKGLWTHTQGGFYHDGRFATLEEVVQHYNTLQELHLNEQQVNDLIQFLLSL